MDREEPFPDSVSIFDGVGRRLGHVKKCEEQSFAALLNNTITIRALEKSSRKKNSSKYTGNELFFTHLIHYIHI